MNESEAAVAPIVKRLHLRLPVQEAFALFTQEIGRWWPLGSHSCSLNREARLRLDGRVRGASAPAMRERYDSGWNAVLRLFEDCTEKEQ